MIDSAIESDREWDRRVRRAYVLELRRAVECREVKRIAELLDWKANHDSYSHELGIA
jgi:hypothetical protein